MFHKARSIPDNVRPGLTEVVNRTRNQIRFAQPDLQYFFEVYNRYIAPKNEPEQITCGHCITKVVGWLRSVVHEWQRHEQTQP